MRTGRIQMNKSSLAPYIIAGMSLFGACALATSAGAQNLYGKEYCGVVVASGADLDLLHVDEQVYRFEKIPRIVETVEGTYVVMIGTLPTSVAERQVDVMIEAGFAPDGTFCLPASEAVGLVTSFDPSSRTLLQLYELTVDEAREIAADMLVRGLDAGRDDLLDASIGNGSSDVRIAGITASMTRRQMLIALEARGMTCMFDDRFTETFKCNGVNGQYVGITPYSLVFSCQIINACDRSIDDIAQ